MYARGRVVFSEPRGYDILYIKEERGPKNIATTDVIACYICN
jgi:hypothetical protein